MTDMPWISRGTIVTRERVFRSSIRGDQYIATHREFHADEEIGHRDTTTVSGVLLGAFPGIGSTVVSDGEVIRTIFEETHHGEIVLHAPDGR